MLTPRGEPMIHVVFERRMGRLAVFGPDGRLWHAIEAAGDASRDGARPPYGPGYPIPPGHYRLVEQLERDPATPEDGPGLIFVADVDTPMLQRLVDAGRARRRGAGLEIACLAGAVGGLAHYGRSAVAIRGGGAVLAPEDDPLAPYQRLTRGDGGVRVHNADLARVMQILAPYYAVETIVFTVLGDPPRMLA